MIVKQKITATNGYFSVHNTSEFETYGISVTELEDTLLRHQEKQKKISNKFFKNLFIGNILAATVSFLLSNHLLYL